MEKADLTELREDVERGARLEKFIESEFYKLDFAPTLNVLIEQARDNMGWKPAQAHRSADEVALRDAFYSGHVEAINDIIRRLQHSQKDAAEARRRLDAFEAQPKKEVRA